jgi:7-cyano-7-deazaguanine synthase
VTVPLVVLSGGMDSATALAFTVATYGAADAITVDYGQRHVREVEAARVQAGRWSSRHDVVDLSDVGRLLTGSALTDTVAVPRGRYDAPTMAATVVPNRNAILATVAAGVAVARGAPAIVLGIHSGDHHIYPDCRPEFVTALHRLLSVANDRDVRVDAPFLHTDKAGILRVGVALDVDYAATWTCYVGGDVSCGTCGSCDERRAAFDRVGIPDPLPYTI